MDEDVNQKISRFIDDDMNADEALALLKKIQSQPALKSKIARYQIAANALSTEQIVPIKADFLTGVQQGIANEPNYLLPVKSPSQVPRQAVIAIAASFALIAVLVTKIDYEKTNSNELKTLSASAAPVIKKQAVIETKQTPKVVLDKVTQQPQNNNQNNRFNDYLQAHNTSLYTNGVATFQPHFQTVSYRQD